MAFKSSSNVAYRSLRPFGSLFYHAHNCRSDAF